MRPNQKVARCECEHDDHFANALGDPPLSVTRKLVGHAYGIDFPRRHIVGIQTPFGAFHVCPACRETCLAEYADDGENVFAQVPDHA